MIRRRFGIWLKLCLFIFCGEKGICDMWICVKFEINLFIYRNIDK